SQNFTVESDFGGFDALHKAAVGGAGSSNGRIDADLPESTEVSLLGLAISKGVGAPVIERIGRIPIKFGAAHPKAFGGFKRAHAAFAGSWGVCDSHISGRVESGPWRETSMAERQAVSDAKRIRSIHLLGRAQAAAPTGST